MFDACRIGRHGCLPGRLAVGLGPRRSLCGLGWRCWRGETGSVRPLELALVCPAGFESVVAVAARRELKGFAEWSISGGFIRARTLATAAQVRAFPCVANSFVVICDTERASVDAELLALSRKLRAVPRPPGLPSRGTFRLRVHDAGTFASTSTAEARHLENCLASWSGLSVSRRSSAVEIWVLRRRDEEVSVLASKLTEGGSKVAPGVLRPELCAALARVEPVSGLPLVLDPFAGSGALGLACSDAGASYVWLNDLARGRRRGQDKASSATRVKWSHLDFRDLDIVSGSVAAIVTDPPWGHHVEGAGDDLGALYRDLGIAAERWLQPGGPLVMLTAAEDRLLAGLLEAPAIVLERSLPVLVNGHKAQVVVARRTDLGRAKNGVAEVS